ncbi:MAG: glycoside hydrolase family 130 protein [Ignavibacteriota bacterium]
MIQKLSAKLYPDPKRVILQFFKLKPQRTKRVIRMVLSLDEKEVHKILNLVMKGFSSRHKNFEENIFINYINVEKFVPFPNRVSKNRKLLIGSYFSKEYSLESAALFNPSIVPHPDQTNLEKDSLRFVMSLRATGEGHISSIEFREGIINKNSDVHFLENSRYSNFAKRKNIQRDEILNKKLKYTNKSTAEVRDLLDSNYACAFSNDQPMCERVLFPNSKMESMGMEDARFVKFIDKNAFTYFGTYTAYNGRKFRTQLIGTKDFINFEVGTLHGNSIKDKGMALFPRKIKNKYVITSRQDSENIFIMFSDDIYSWNDAKVLKTSEHPWEYIQVGNCGSPIETKKGWILITHAVGPMRKYVISAVLLDLENPAKIIGSLKDPLIEPNEVEREGYVPNVVYSCGSMTHKNNIIIPYAFSDSACGFAKIVIDELLDKLN